MFYLQGAEDIEVTRTTTNQSEFISKSRLSETWTHGMPLSPDDQELVVEAGSKFECFLVYFSEH